MSEKLSEELNQFFPDCVTSDEIPQKYDLNEKEVLFLIKYIEHDCVIAPAYRAIYDSTNYGRGRNILNKPGARKMIQNYMDGFLNESKLKLEKKIIDTYHVRAFYDPSDFLNIDGTPKFDSWDEIPKDLRVVVDNIETKVYGKDGDVSKTVLKLADRDKAIEKLAKYITLFKEDEGGGVRLSKDTEEMISSVFNSVKPLTLD